ncbi:hypothetical protein ERO13_A07G044000v2 [Gossypium hirsutum]|nr:hypothetical protein ERO13_A07G044000v2 [Gossypium hirsutum]
MQQQQLHARLMKCLSCSHSHLPLPPPRPPPFYSLQRFASSQPKGVAKVILKKGKTQLFKDGSPMVYSGAIDRIIGRPPPKTGDIVLVADGTEKPIGWGLYNSVSMFCVRLMQLEEEATRDPSCALDMEKLLETRINAAVELRRGLGLPSATTNAYRLVNSEGDRPSVENLKVGVEAADLKELHPSTCPQRTKVIENGISYAISLEGQKTGFYADQRENRMFLSTISHGQRVLDVCCYSGGFALNAAKGGAMSITGVDTSLPALELARENIALNNLDPEKTSFLREDATVFMKGALSRNDSWDIVILDPPKLAPRRKVLQSASGMYRNLNSLAMKITGRGGLLMSCSCSGAMTQSGTFLRTLQGAASMAERKITVLRQSGAGCDHPIDPSYPEGAYLSNILLRVL